MMLATMFFSDNGSVSIMRYQIIKKSYEKHLRNHTFIEDVRGYAKQLEISKKSTVNVIAPNGLPSGLA